MTEPRRPDDPPRAAADSQAATAFAPRAGGRGGMGETCPVWPDRYEDAGELGRGGMGEVRAARDRILDREVALKVLRAHDATAEDHARFAQEARVTGRLAHPQIPPVHELGVTADGRPYFAMKRVYGASLRARLDLVRAAPTRRRAAAFPLDLGLTVVAQVGEALAYAHAHGVVHRDLKPDNVMVGEHGEVQVMDWGLARVTDVADGAAAALGAGTTSSCSAFATRDGSIAGTPAYMASEQARGLVHAVDARTDVFALGAILYALLSLAPPYAADDLAETLALAAAGAWRPIGERIRADRTGAPRPPPELVSIAHRAMARDPADRYPDMSAMLADLRAYRAHEPVRAHRDGPLARVAKWLRRHPRGASWAAAVFVTGLAFVHANAALDRAEARTATHRAATLRAQAERDGAVATLARADERLEAERRRGERLGILAHGQLGSEAQAAIDELGLAWTAARERGMRDDAFLAQLGRGRIDGYLEAYDGLFEVLAITGTPPLASHHVDRALLRGARGDADGAVSELDAALALRPGWSLALVNRGILRRARGDAAGAASDFDAVAPDDPRRGMALVERAGLRLHQGDAAGAIADLSAALALGPTAWRTADALGQVQEERGQREAAIAAYQLAYRYCPEGPDRDALIVRLRRLGSEPSK